MKTICTLPVLAKLLPNSRRVSLALLGLSMTVGAASAQTPAFPRNEPFKDKTAPNFSFGGAARLTGVGGAGNDAEGQGYLRLTTATENQAGYAIDNVGFPSGAGFTISFEFFSYGKTTADGADGFSVFLVDADRQPVSGFRIGATGGSLGYAQKTINPIADGVSNGYIGIGIDEFGNYSNGQEGRSGGSTILDDSGKAPNAIAIRGAGNGSAATDYPYLIGTAPDALGFTLDVPTARAQPGSPDYRRAFIDVVPTKVGATTTYRITVRVQHGNAVASAIDNFVVATPPSKLRLGFSGSTGGSTNVHEIRNLNIVQVPFANNDLATTNYNEPVTLGILANDIAPGAQIDPATVDLDPNTAGQQTKLTVSEGEFSVGTDGVLTFKPSGSFAGTVVAPYTVQSILRGEYTSSPANIRINVRGADLKAAINGPAAALAGTPVVYTMTTTNEGAVDALGVAPKMQLPANLPPLSVTALNGSYNPSNGEVTFDKIDALPSAAPPIINTVTFVAPNAGAVTGVATVTSAVPDPQLTNNTSSLRTNLGNTPLPVELARFEARAQELDGLLNWTTAQEKNNNRFEVERAYDGATFERVGTVAGHGNTQTATSYRYRDAGAGQHGRTLAYYRLRQVDHDGTAQYSPVRTVRFASAAAPTAVTIYPNPAPGAATLDLTGLPAADYSVQVLDLTGRLLQTHTFTGAQQHAFSTQTLRPGSYLVRVRGGKINLTLPLARY